MEQQTQITRLLDLMVQPGFCVKENQIIQCNQAAQRLLVPQGEDVRPLLLTGAEEYAAFSGGCLYLSLKLGNSGCGAAVIRAEDCDVFVLDPETDSSELYALALAAQDLRGPMSNVMIAADQIAQTEDDILREQTGRLNRGLHQLLRIINNMSDALLYSTASQQETRNITGIFSEIFEKAQTLLAQADLSLSYEGPAEDIYCLADAQQLERAVLNILSNAAKYTPAGGTITAKLRRQGGLLRLSIQDSGPGIADEILNNIFCRYLRHPGIEDSRFGLGLGMVLIRAAAVNHGGTVLIDRPQGARITMTMALRQSQDTLLRSPVFRVDYASGRDHAMVELAQSLPAKLYEK